MSRLHAIGRACMQAVILFSLGGLAATVHAAPDLIPGTYRCSAYNVSGGGGSCRNMQPLQLRADGSYQHSSTRGHWRSEEGKLLLSESRLWGPGEITGSDTVRFEYDYRGWRHTVTWVCRDCASASAASTTGPSTRGGLVGVSLTLEFGEPIGGVSGFSIVPAEAARHYSHHAPLPKGAVQGVAWEVSSTAVALATNRNNQLMSGRRYVVFLAWPRETIAVALLDLPPTDEDYAATLPATLDGAGVSAQLGGGSSSTSEPPGYSAPTPTLPPPVPSSDANSGRQEIGNDGKEAAKCNPQVPRYSQPGCIE